MHAFYRTEFVAGYMEAIAFTDCDCDHPDMQEADFSPTMRAICIADCEQFCRENEELLQDLSPSQCGHDFWLTRRGSGTDFRDRGLGKVGDLLTEAALKFGEVELEVSDADGMIYMR